ncbi:SDR family oxidoreductase [Streptomyces sp. NPDC026672]|uniref:SDR family NAD(P)-dependent oxidoreductase n=1 Tax=unclassified Streptomyces TaxID=2593676 RepID=UPI0033CEF100
MASDNLTGRTALVTGSTSGIGRSTALLLAERGAHVLISGRNKERGAAVVDAVHSAGGKAALLTADLVDATSGIDLAERALEVTGAVDILVNNAGTGTPASTALTTEADRDATIGTNVKAHFFLVGRLAPLMTERGRGAIVNVTSMAGQYSVAELGTYGASKAALNLLTKSWAAEFAPHVRVNTVAPGTVLTPLVEPMGDWINTLAAQAPLSYVAQPGELATTIAFLVSDQASFVTGALLNVDGRRTAV